MIIICDVPKTHDRLSEWPQTLDLLQKKNRQEFRGSLNEIRTEVAELDRKVSNVDERVDECESRISTIEDNFDDKITSHEEAITTPMNEKGDFPVDRTLICIGLPETVREESYDKTQELVEHGLGLTKCGGGESYAYVIEGPSQTRSPKNTVTICPGQNSCFEMQTKPRRDWVQKCLYQIICFSHR